MKLSRLFKCVISLFVAAAMCFPAGCNEKADPWVSAVFGGGPFVTGIEESAEILKSSDFNTMIIWSVHVNENGDLVLNDVPVASFGRCIAKKPIREEWAKLKEKGSSIKRVEISIGAWGCADFENIKSLSRRTARGKTPFFTKISRRLSKQRVPMPSILMTNPATTWTPP